MSRGPAPVTPELRRAAAARYKASGDRLDVVIRDPAARRGLAALRAEAERTGEPLAAVVSRVLAAVKPQ